MPIDFTIIDTNEPVTHKVLALKRAGISKVIRYLTPAGPPKCVSVIEARVLSSEGLKLGLVYQTYNNSYVRFSADAGYRAATWSLDYLKHTLRAPAGAGISFAVDYDASSTEIAMNIKNYFREVHNVLKNTGYLVGIYGSGLACRRMKEWGLVDFTWRSQSLGFNESRHYADWDMAQGLNVSVSGVGDCDPNWVRPGRNVGFFVPFATPAPSPLKPPVRPPIPPVIDPVVPVRPRLGSTSWLARIFGWGR